MLGNDDRIELRNGSNSTIVVDGYRNEPYLRFLPDGTVQVNRRSPALYLNEDRFGQVEIPRSARPSAPPSWQQVAQNGRGGRGPRSAIVHDSRPRYAFWLASQYDGHHAAYGLRLTAYGLRLTAYEGHDAASGVRQVRRS